MTIADWLADTTTQLEALEQFDVHPAASRPSVMERVRLFLLRRRIDAMLRRTIAPQRYEPVSRLPPHLMRDIGLNPPL